MKRGINSFIAQTVLDELAAKEAYVVPSPDDGRAVVRRWESARGGVYADDARLAGLWGLSISGSYLTPRDGDYTASFWSRDKEVAQRAIAASRALDAAHTRLIVAINAGE